MPDREDRWIADVAAELRRPVTLSAGFDARVMAALRATPRRTPLGGLWDWLREPRVVSFSPLGGLAAGAAVAAVALAGVWMAPRPAGPVAAAAPAHPATAAPVDVAFVLLVPQARSVAVAGDFNGWDPARTSLVRGASGLWTVDVPLAPGRYTYAFVVDGRRFVPDPAAPRAVGEDFGTPSSVVTVEGGAL